MRSHKNKYQNILRRKPVIAVVIVLLLAGVIAAVSLARSHKATTGSSTTVSGSKVQPLNTIDYSSATASDNTANENRKDNPSSSQPTLDSQKSAGLNVSITQAAIDTTNKLLRVRTLVDGVTSGSCDLVVSKAGQADITATSTVALHNNSYSCENFDIPFSRFPQGGDWRVNIKITHNLDEASDAWPEPVTIPNL